MSLCNLHAESVIAGMVESMLPMSSDRKLGLQIGIDLHVWDHGYDKTGNTLERKEKNFRRFLYFLFIRPSNYTKVLFWEPQNKAKGHECYPSQNTTQEWYLLSDHDSCWRDAVGSKLTDVVMRSMAAFDGRMKSGKPLEWSDLGEFITFMDKPHYVYLETAEQRVKEADRFSTEGRWWNVRQHGINFSRLEMIESPDPKWMASSGLLIKESEMHYRYLESCRLHKESQN